MLHSASQCNATFAWRAARELRLIGLAYGQRTILRVGSCPALAPLEVILGTSPATFAQATNAPAAHGSRRTVSMAANTAGAAVPRLAQCPPECGRS